MKLVKVSICQMTPDSKNKNKIKIVMPMYPFFSDSQQSYEVILIHYPTHCGGV